MCIMIFEYEEQLILANWKAYLGKTFLELLCGQKDMDGSTEIIPV